MLARNLCSIMTLLLQFGFCSSLVVLAQTKIPTSQQITPTAAPGSTILPLATNLRNDRFADGANAVSTALSPDGRTLLVLTSGYNLYFLRESGTLIEFPVLNPQTGQPTSTLTFRHEWIFVYDVTGPTPVQRQKINIPRSYVGLVWSPAGDRFYVSGGSDNLVYIYRNQGGTFVPDAPFITMNTTAPLLSTPAGPAIASFGLIADPAIAGLGLSPDGRRLYVANHENDSVSVVDTQTRQIIREVVFSKPGTTTARMVGEYPYWIVVRSLPNGTDRVFVSSQRDGQVVFFDGTDAPRVIRAGSAPNKMILSADGSRLYVADGNRDAIHVISTAQGVLMGTVSLSRPNFRWKGANPNSLALSPDGRTLYVTLGGENAVAVLDVATLRVKGRIPTAWYPNSVSVSADGQRLFVVNSRSLPGPNPDFATYFGQGSNPTNREPYIFGLEKSSLLTIPVPNDMTLATLSLRVDTNNGFLDSHNSAVMTALRDKIKHVIYIVKENRTYDQVLGDLPQGNGDASLTLFPQAITPNHHKLATDFVTLDNFHVTGQGSGEGWNWSSQATNNEYVSKATPPSYGNGFSALDVFATNRNLVVAYPERGTPATPFNSRLTGLLDPTGQSATLPTARDIGAQDGDGDLTPGAVGGYLWDEVLRSGKSLRHYGFFTDYTYYFVPPPHFIPITRTPFASNIPQGPPLKQSLIGHSDLYYRGYDIAMPDRYRFEEWKREFDLYVKNKNLPALQILMMPVDHFGSFGENVAQLNTPELQMADNDYAMGKLVEAVSQSPYWKDTAIFVLEDDAQDGPDHVDAHRSPAFVISPYTKRRSVVSTHYTTVNMMRTMVDLLGVKPLSMFDATADPMSDVFTLTPNLAPYQAVLPGSLCRAPVSPALIPECSNNSVPRTRAVKPLHDGEWWVNATKQFDFKQPDALNSAEFNKVLWRGVKGERPYPGIRRGGKPVSQTESRMEP